MRWGERSAKTGRAAWVRPLHSIVATFGPETEEPDVVPFDVDGIEAGDDTRGHRFMAPAPSRCAASRTMWRSCRPQGRARSGARARTSSCTDAKNLASRKGFELVEDEVLLDEVAGLVEWPVVLMGIVRRRSSSTIPGEVIRATIRNNQKCFVLRDPATGGLVNKFLLVERRGHRWRQGHRRRQWARHPRAVV